MVASACVSSAAADAETWVSSGLGLCFLLRRQRRFKFLAWRPLLVLLSAAAVACVSGACVGGLFLAAFACSAAAAELMCCHLDAYVRGDHLFLLQMILMSLIFFFSQIA